MSTTEKWLAGSIATLVSTELNSLANNAPAISTAAFDNTQGGGGGDGYTLCTVQLEVTFGSAPAANTGVSVWFLARPDGTNYEDGDASTTPARAPDVVFPVRAVTTLQRISRRIMLPWGIWKTLVKNDGTGQAMASSANQLKVLPYTPQGV